MTDETADYFDQQDTFGEWIAAQCNIGGTSRHDWERSTDLYAAWSAFAEKVGERPGNRNAFAERLRTIGVEHKVEKIDGKTQRVFRRVMLRRDT